jgi:hypothetical protein
MKRLIVRFLLLATLFSTAAGAQTFPHNVSGMLGGSLHFVPFGPGIYDVYDLGVFSGQLKSLGFSNIFTFHQPTEQGTSAYGHFFIVAANHDKIQGTYESTAAPGPQPDIVIVTVTLEIDGGTGRISRANGTMKATVYVKAAGFDVLDWPAVWVLNGTIEY